MPKYRVTETYLKKVWYEKNYECTAADEEEIRNGEYTDEKILSEEEIESEHDGWTEFDDIELLE